MGRYIFANDPGGQIQQSSLDFDEGGVPGPHDKFQFIAIGVVAYRVVRNKHGRVPKLAIPHSKSLSIFAVTLALAYTAQLLHTPNGEPYYKPDPYRMPCEYSSVLVEDPLMQCKESSR